MPARTLMAINSQSLFSPHLTIIMVFSGRSAICRSAGFGDFGRARTTKSVASVHKPGGAEHARWVFEYDPGRDDDDEVGYKLGEHAFLPGDYVSISGKDGKLQTFRVISVNPVLLSLALVKSFELEIEV